jgi:PAS domain S-box-containing protein
MLSIAQREVTLLIHDTLIIIDCNDAACELFQCDHDTLVGFSIFDLVWSDDFRGLSRLRMRMLREHGVVPPVEYLFHRFDGSRFYGRVATKKVLDGQYQSIITFKYNI